MARKGIIQRELARASLEQKHRQLRKELKQVIRDPSRSYEERFEAMMKLDSLSKNSSKVRARRRDQDGRPRGFYSRFGQSRSNVRKVVCSGDAPGAKSSSW